MHDGTLKGFIENEQRKGHGLASKSINKAFVVVSTILNREARVWRRAWKESGLPTHAGVLKGLTTLDTLSGAD